MRDADSRRMTGSRGETGEHTCRGTWSPHSTDPRMHVQTPETDSPSSARGWWWPTTSARRSTTCRRPASWSRSMSWSLNIGGGASNTAVDLARLGVRAAICARVGDDIFGRFVAETLVDARRGRRAA